MQSLGHALIRLIGEEIWKKKPALPTPDLRLPASSTGEKQISVVDPACGFIMTARTDSCPSTPATPSGGERILGAPDWVGRAGLTVEDPVRKEGGCFSLPKKVRGSPGDSSKKTGICKTGKPLFGSPVGLLLWQQPGLFLPT